MRNCNWILLLLLAFLLLPPVVEANQDAQGWCENGADLDVTSGVSSVTQARASSPQCPAQAAIFVGIENSPVANPFTANTSGRRMFCVANGRHDIQVSGSVFTTPVAYTEAILRTADAISGLYQILQNNFVSVLQQSKLNVVSPANYANDPDDGSAVCPVAELKGAGVAHFSSLTADPGAEPVHSPQKDLGVTEALIAQSSGGAVSGKANSPSRPIFNKDKIQRGENPYADLRDYGAYATFSSTTCSTSAGSVTVTLGSASNFKDGEYATCYNAGPAAMVNTPSAPAVTPSLNSGGIDAIAGGTGSTSYSYCIVAEDKFNGRSACSPTGTTAIGPPALGIVGYKVAAATRSNNTVTLTTSAAHNLAVGTNIWFCCTADTSYDGEWITASGTAGSTITFQSNVDTRNGASTSTRITGAWVNFNTNVFAFFSNRITWTHDVNALRHHIYGPNCPTSCNWMGQTVLDFFDDFGPTMLGNQTRPSYIPAAAPGVSANQHFSFKINAGGGTTTLLASANAGASVSGNGMVSDAGPALLAAANAATLAGSYSLTPVYVPAVAANAGIYQVNSYVDFCSLPGTHGVKLLLNGVGLSTTNTLGCATNIEGYGLSNQSPAFGFFNQPAIQGTGFPLVFNPFSNIPTHFKNIRVASQVSNGGLGAYLVNPINSTFEDVYWSDTNGGCSDSIGMMLIMNGIGSGGFYQVFTRNIFAGGAGQFCNIGASPYNTVVFTSNPNVVNSNGVSNLHFRYGWFLYRGSIDLDMATAFGSQVVVIENMSGQSSTVPVLTLTGPWGYGLGTEIRISDYDTADYNTPILANLSGAPGVIQLTNVPAPALNWNIVTGRPTSGFVLTNAQDRGINSFESSTQPSIISLPLATGNPFTVNAVEQQFYMPVNIGNIYPLFSGGNSIPTAPTCVTNVAGPPFTPAGTNYLSYAPVWPNGTIGLTSTPVSCTSDGATQQSIWTIPAAINGAVGYQWYVTTAKILISSSVPESTALTYTFLGGYTGNAAPTQPAGGLAGIQAGQVWTTDMTLSPTTAPTGAASETKFYHDRTLNWPAFKPNGNTSYLVPGISGSIANGHSLCANGMSGAYVDCLTTKAIASGSSKLGTSVIGAQSCAVVVTVAATGVTTTDAIYYSFDGAPSGAYSTGLFIQSYVTPGNVNFLVCNPTARNFTPPAATLNWRVIR